MTAFDEPKDLPDHGNGVSRRTFLKSNLAGMLLPTLALGPTMPGYSSRENAVILLVMVGGPSSHETFHPLPDAPENIRGPFEAIATRLPGVLVSECFPCLAQRLDRVSLVRTLFHDSAPLHEVGLQLLHTGRVLPGEPEDLAVKKVSTRPPEARSIPSYVVTPDLLGSLGMSISRGQELPMLGQNGMPGPITPNVVRSIPFGEKSQSRKSQLFNFSNEPEAVLQSYGPTLLGQECLRARRLVEAGTKLVVINIFQSVFQEPSWDAHGRSPFATFEHYRKSICPDFDWAFCALLDDLESRGMLDRTLVVATGELGRSPFMNAFGGRDHWTKAWSALIAGGPAPRGEVLGATDRWGGEPVSSAVPLQALHATMAEHLGLAGYRSMSALWSTV